jgi:hypothetical protein
MSKKPTDPLVTTKEYTYSKVAYGNAYQIKADWEGDSVSFYSPHSYALIPPSAEGGQGGVFGIPQTYAATGNPTLTYIKGNYNGLVVKTQTGNTIYVLAVPSIVTSQTGTLIDVLSLSGSILVNNKTNSGGIAFAPSVVYSGASLPTNDTTLAITNMTTAIQNAYSGSVVASDPLVQKIITASDPSSIITAGSALITNIGGTPVTSSQTYASCTATSYSGYTITALSHGTPQTFTKTGATSNGINTFSLPVNCANGTLSYGTESTATTCTTGYTASGNSCNINTYTISGSFGTNASGATISVCGSNTTADASGNFSATRNYGSTCNTITATSTSYTCTTSTNGPASLTGDFTSVAGSCVTPVINLTIASNTQNYNVLAAAGSPTKAVIATVTINAGVAVGSSSTAAYAMTIPVFPTGSTVTIINNGYIVGAGGQGGGA